MTGVEVDALIPKSTTGTVWVRVFVPVVEPFAPALADTATCDRWAVIEGVRSTSTAAVAFTLRVGILQRIVAPCAAVQLPEPLVTLAVAVEASPVVGTVALKTRRLAVSGPVFDTSKVNENGVSAATGVGDESVGGSSYEIPPMEPIFIY